MEYIRSFLALFVLLMLLLYLVPGEGFRKYIQFFSEIVLAIGFLYPVLSALYDSDAFLEKVEYEAFTEGLSEIARDTRKIEFLQNDYYIGEYERAIGMDVERIARQYDFDVTSVRVHLADDYTLDAISLALTEPGGDAITVGRVNVSGGAGEEAVCAGLKKELSQYYQIDEALIEIHYSAGR